MKKRWVIGIIVVLIIAAIGGGIWWWLSGGQDTSDGIGSGANLAEKKYYSDFTGLEVDKDFDNHAPTFCVQIPNGSTDGARPQVGLTEAGVVFEAIAETGITRFAAIFQNPNTGVIGPIRSLRPYYLEWDTPFDCTIVHDGGSAEALAAVNNGSYRNLDENFNFMWKETYINGQYRYWNNVFTSPEKLLQFNTEKGYLSSNPKVLPRLTQDEVQQALSQNNCAEECDGISNIELANTINISFSGLADYNVNYSYNMSSNTYNRAYGNGEAHLSYNCPSGVTNFENCGEAVQVAPSTVIAMRVQENTMSDAYHENIKTTGTGVAYIFQNGQVAEGTWKKANASSQLEFHDTVGNEIKFTPGQIWIAAIPQFGSVSWE